MIEGKSPKDIRKYEAKAVGSFTLRQVICVLLALMLDFFLFKFVLEPLNTSIDSMVYIYIFIDVPIVAFIIKPQGMPMEQYLRDVELRYLIAPVYRKAKNVVIKKNKKVYTSKQLKESEKRLKEEIKKHPEYIAYK